MRPQEEARKAMIPVDTNSSHVETHPLDVQDDPHRIEQEVQRRLLSDPRLQFSSLVVRRIPEGVCLEGVLETAEDCSNVSQMIRTVEGVNRVLNHLVIHSPPAKG